VTDKPHILVVMTDQQRADCLGCAGHPQLTTPNLDRIAGEGARFTQATTASPMCMPARASFATSLYPHDHGMWRNGGALSPDCETLFQVLQRSGYFTALVGKAHHYDYENGMDLREQEPFMHQLGFRYVHETAGPAASVRTDSYLSDEWRRRGLWDKLRDDYEERGKNDNVARPSALSTEDHLDSYVGRKAIEFVDAYAEPMPLFLFVGFGGPHPPWDAPAPYASMYRAEDTPAPIPIPQKPDTLPDHVEPQAPFRVGASLSGDEIARIRANYYGKISLIDDCIGGVLAAFERRGWLADLLVVFLSDHGEMLGDHGRLSKGNFYESSLRIPLIVRWPGRIPAGTVSNALVENVDVFPTLLEMAGIEDAGWRAGSSLWPLLRGRAAGVREGQLCEGGRQRDRVMLRTDRHKIAIDASGSPFMLFDLADDPHEQRNLVGEPSAASLADRLRDELEARVRETSRNGSSVGSPNGSSIRNG